MACGLGPGDVVRIDQVVFLSKPGTRLAARRLFRRRLRSFVYCRVSQCLPGADRYAEFLMPVVFHGLLSVPLVLLLAL